MPKIKPTTLFCKRTLPILLIDNSEPNSLMKASMLVQPIMDELVKQNPKASPDVIHVKETGNSVYDAMNTIEALLSISQPTIVVAPGTKAVRSMGNHCWDSCSSDIKKISCGAISATAEAFMSYIQFLVAAGGGFIVELDNEEGSNDMNSALPILHFNAGSNSYIDIEYKVASLIRSIVSSGSINHCMTIQSVANNPLSANKLAICLGSWGRPFGDEKDGRTIKMVVNVSGIAGTPITIEEFIRKIWCASEIDRSLLNPSNALIVRNPSIESKLVFAKVIASKKMAAGIKFIEV